jgi:phosphohistidine phosphatase
MDIILWRHAEAKAGMPDRDRPLTAKGRKQASKMAGWLQSILPERCNILVSPALRTVQTAEALGRKFRILDDLGPDADPERILSAVKWPDAKGPVLIVGHQPALGQIAAMLMCGQVQSWRIRKGDVWWIAQRERSRSGEKGMFLRAVMSPEMIVEHYKKK